ncbi:FtsK/SpoIIIE domain-containing protein [Lactococcus lactis]|uniref:FtsK/SpoIIIE domain-containing protein n=1 Tax=Lactococcus lactis TaxID=1358 RepID=UPI003D127C8F
MKSLKVRLTRTQILGSLAPLLVGLPAATAVSFIIYFSLLENFQINLSVLFLLGLFLLFLSVISCALLYYKSKFSFNHNQKMRALLRGATERLDFLKFKNGFESKKVEWRYHIDKKGDLYSFDREIWLLPSGTVTADIDSVGKQLQNYLIAATHKDCGWTIKDKRLDDGFYKFTFGNRAERITIENLADIKSNDSAFFDKQFAIKLDSEKYWKSQNSMLVVGSTGSGKTSLLKTLSLMILGQNDNNEIWIIDGKGFYISQAFKSTGASAHVATDGATAVALLDNLCKIMDDRYAEMLAADTEDDCTYIELFPERGTIVLIADELLAIVAKMQADDKKLKPSDRLETKLQQQILNLLVKGRQASVRCIISSQALPVSILGGSSAGSTSRDNIGARIVLGSSISQVQSQEIFGYPATNLERTSEEYSGWIWLDNTGMQSPKVFLSPFYDDTNLPFKATLRRIVAARNNKVA